MSEVYRIEEVLAMAEFGRIANPLHGHGSGKPCSVGHFPFYYPAITPNHSAMRGEADRESIEDFIQLLGIRAAGAGRVYLVGGTTAVLRGWRGSTINIDLKLEPEPAGAFETNATLKDPAVRGSAGIGVPSHGSFS